MSRSKSNTISDTSQMFSSDITGNEIDNLPGKPFLKWAGGKKRLLPKITSKFPFELNSGGIERYVEPFVGGGAVFFSILSNYDLEEYIVNDSNKPLIDTYRTIQKYVDELICTLQSFESEYFDLKSTKQRDFFNGKRKEFNQLRKRNDKKALIQKSSLLIFLNKTCYNGIYRTNSDGNFNVPHGKNANITICDASNIRAINESISKVNFFALDFKTFIKQKLKNIGSETLLYSDPPYTINHGNNGFIAYNERIFSWNDQIQLNKHMKSLSERGVKIMVSNAHHNDITQLYSSPTFTSNTIIRQSLIGGTGSERKRIKEYLFTSYEIG